MHSNKQQLESQWRVAFTVGKKGCAEEDWATDTGWDLRGLQLCSQLSHCLAVGLGTSHLTPPVSSLHPQHGVVEIAFLLELPTEMSVEPYSNANQSISEIVELRENVFIWGKQRKNTVKKFKNLTCWFFYILIKCLDLGVFNHTKKFLMF